MERSVRPTAVMLIVGAAAVALPISGGHASDGRLGRGDADKVAPFVGTYQGSFRSAVETPWPDDDLNLNPCVQGRDDCSVHRAPLKDIFVTFRLADRVPALSFHYTRADADAGRAMDLLGLGCKSRVAEARDLEKADPVAGGAVERQWRLTFRLEAGRCPVGTSLGNDHELNLYLGRDGSSGEPRLEVEILRGTTDRNYLYTVEDGQRRRVKVMRPGNNERGEGYAGDYVCVEDAMGEFPPERCTTVEKTKTGFVLPFPVSGDGVGVVFGTNRKTSLKLERTQGAVEADYFSAQFAPAGG